MSTESIETLIADYFAAIRAMDGKTWVATFAEDAVVHDPVDQAPMKGHEQIGQFFQNIAGLFDKVGLQENFVQITGNEVAVKWTGQGVGKNGTEVTFEGIDIFEVNDTGKIQTLRGYWNPSAMIAKLQS